MYCNSNQIYQKLINAGIKTSTGNITIHYLNVSANVNNKDAVGDLLQEWLGEWFKANQINFRLTNNTQIFPDFLLHPTSNQLDLLEVKTFNYDADPAFDVANFESYCKSLETDAYRLDADYLIFGYQLINYQLEVKEVWLKKIWQITGSSSRFPVCCQVKKDVIYNIRPAKWYTKSNRIFNSRNFKSRRDFVNALHQTLLQYPKTKTQSLNWFQTVEDNYLKHTGQLL